MREQGLRTYLIVRHAQSANNALPEYQRVCDPGLTDKGKLQAEHLAKFLSSQPIGQIYCSGFLRSIETAVPITKATGLPAYVHGQLHEVKGCYSGYIEKQLVSEPGLGRSAILERYAHWEIDPTIDDRGWNFNRSVESEEEADTRADGVASWLKEHAAKEQGIAHRLTVLVIHADFKVKLLRSLRMLNREASRSKEEPWNYICPKNTSISKVTFSKDDLVSISDYNAVAHLPRELVTE